MTAAASGCARSGTFGGDLALLQKYTDVVVLHDADDQAQVAVVPLYQGRVMTSTADGPGGLSYGWLNDDLIASDLRGVHINVFGGEDRLWFGPEGGPYSIFFAPEVEQNLDNWYTPEAIDWGAWKVVDISDTHVTFAKQFALLNAANFVFEVQADRTVRLLDRATVNEKLGVNVPAGVRLVAYESDNRLTNAGKNPWQKKNGLLSIWILGMYNPSPTTTIVIPFKPGPADKLGPIVNDAYFGQIAGDRLKIDEANGVIYFKGDGESRGKIGVGPQRVKPFAGSYDAAHGVLTLVQFTVPDDPTEADYVNSMWGKQDHPYAGDVVNSYNDGPPEPGKPPLGPFYELESSSPGAALKPGETLEHVHRTIHLQGDRAALDAISRATLGVGLDAIEGAF
ncbi:hypothetical protein HED60_12800 [Planctomycetales bacterium ZRK34]|nr:hypothetical protein HED60_12800 [Planctomycetales bacterium ZRK34]